MDDMYRLDEYRAAYSGSLKPGLFAAQPDDTLPPLNARAAEPRPRPRGRPPTRKRGERQQRNDADRQYQNQAAERLIQQEAEAGERAMVLPAGTVNRHMEQAEWSRREQRLRRAQEDEDSTLPHARASSSAVNSSVPSFIGVGASDISSSSAVNPSGTSFFGVGASDVSSSSAIRPSIRNSSALRSPSPRSPSPSGRSSSYLSLELEALGGGQRFCTPPDAATGRYRLEDLQNISPDKPPEPVCDICGRLLPRDVFDRFVRGRKLRQRMNECRRHSTTFAAEAARARGLPDID